MTRKPVDRNTSYMKENWGTIGLISDYGIEDKFLLREVMYDTNPKKHFLKEQTELHEKIRNDEDYNDWDYGTEPCFGKPQ